MSSLTPNESDPIRISVAEYLRMVEEGLIGEDEKVELLEGVIVPMTPSGPRHAAVLSKLQALIQLALGERGVVRGQMPFVIGGRSLPEPDLAVVPGRAGDYYDAYPSRALLVVEVVDSSLAKDRLWKARLYAAAGIPEYWVVDLQHGQIEVLRQPVAERARYEDVRWFARGESIRLSTVSDVVIPVDEALLRAG